VVLLVPAEDAIAELGRVRRRADNGKVAEGEELLDGLLGLCHGKEELKGRKEEKKEEEAVRKKKKKQKSFFLLFPFFGLFFFLAIRDDRL